MGGGGEKEGKTMQGEEKREKRCSVKKRGRNNAG